MKTIKNVSVIALIIFIAYVILNIDDEVDLIKNSNVNQNIAYATLSKEDLNFKRFVSNISSKTEIVVLSESGTSTLEYSKNSNNIFKNITDSSIKLIVEYKTAITIPTNKIKITENKVSFNEEDFTVSYVEVINKNIIRSKDLFGKAFTDDEVIALEKLLVEEIKEKIKNDNSIMQTSKENLEVYLTTLANNFNISIDIY